MISIFLREETVSLSKFLSSPAEYLKGVVRLVNKKSESVGLFLDAEALKELLEEFDSRSSVFLEKLEKSRSSGRVSSASVKKRLGL